MPCITKPTACGWPGLAAVLFGIVLLAGRGEDGRDFFTSRVEPVLAEHCYACHSHAAGKTRGGLALDSRGGWATGGERGPAVIPGDPEGSLLMRAVRRVEENLAMPPKAVLPGDLVDLLAEWIRRGAPDPRVIRVAEATTNAWWAVQPLTRPEVPAGMAGHPVDAFVMSALAARGEVLRPEADARVLVRRLHVDLHGLLPTPQEVREAPGDGGPESWGRVVDRMLASPRYGERWARHWLDVVRFAETHGHDQDRPREDAWRYRDYVVQALNADTPYGRFVEEQVAADVLFPEEPGLIPALGFLAAGPWDESSLRDIREDTLDREIGRYLDRDDILTTVFSSVAGVTVHCARCHDHKFDPIPQRDYYALQAVFAGTEKADRLYDPDPAVNARRQYWMRLQVALDRKDAGQVEALLTEALREDLRAWESGAAAEALAWHPVRPTVFAAAEGTELSLREDGSLVASGRSPATERYTVVFPLEQAGVTALRLEVLTDDALPAKGPGRAENGNLHLTEIQVEANGERVALRNPGADFSQEGWDIARAVDGDPKTGWGIHPREGMAHAAVFELAPRVPLERGVQLTVVLEQEHGRQHTIGRFRLSVTTQAGPVRVEPLPEAVARALALPREGRTPAEQFGIDAHYLGKRLARELGALPEPQRVYAGASVFPVNGGQKPVTRPRSVHLLRRGEITQPREEARPGTLSCVAGVPFELAADDDEGARRAALARWLSHRDNPLTWRVIVNRVWQQHFGQGLVETPNDFGRMGSPPRHPELLDWLAVTFRDELGGSLKRLHRLILTSGTWRQVSAGPGSAHAFQPLRRRLDAETFRDSVLRMSGRLDLTMGGPSVKHFAMAPGIHVTPKVDYADFDVDSAGAGRRAIYRFLFRTLPDPLMDVLDCPAGDQSAPVRSESFTSLQAFALMNHPFVVRQSRHAADRLGHAGGDPGSQVQAAVWAAFQREPCPEEVERLEAHARRHGMANLVRVLINSSEFHFVE